MIDESKHIFVLFHIATNHPRGFGLAKHAPQVALFRRSRNDSLKFPTAISTFGGIFQSSQNTQKQK